LRELRSEAIRRALGRCEYCRISQAGQDAAFDWDLPHLVDFVTRVGEEISEGGKNSCFNLKFSIPSG
jgi:hypothetical protein